MNRVVITTASRTSQQAECALGLGRSLRFLGDETTRVIATDMPDRSWQPAFDQVWPSLDIPKLLEELGADQALILPPASLAFKRVGPVFEYCAGRGACSQTNIPGGPWLVYCEKGGDPTEPGKMPAIPDPTEPGKMPAIPAETDFFSATTGMVGRLELDIVQNRCAFVCKRPYYRFVQPFIFCAAGAESSPYYVDQLESLALLERYEQKHGFGYMSPLHKFTRSIHKRILRAKGRL